MYGISSFTHKKTHNCTDSHNFCSLISEVNPAPNITFQGPAALKIEPNGLKITF